MILGCGNGIVEDGEYCDDGNPDELDDCATDCTPAAPFRAYHQTIADVMTRLKIPGGSIAVTHEGRLVLARPFGFADGEVDVSRRSRFRIASMSKTITAVAIMKLVEDGRLGLDDHAFSYLDHLPSPEGADADPRLADITIRHLLQHMGGWDRGNFFDPVFVSNYCAEQLGEPGPATPDMIVRFMRRWQLQFDPGAYQRYSNFGYTVLGRVIESVTQEPYERWVQDNILGPTGANGMQIGKTLLSERAPDEVRYYVPWDAPLAEQSVFPDIEGPVPWPYGGWYHPGLDAAGGWIASPIEYTRFLLAVDGRDTVPDILDASTIDELIAPPAGSTGSSWYAKGVDVRQVGDDYEWSHTGAIPGTATVFVRTADGFTWVALFNFHSFLPGYWNEIDAAIRTAQATVTEWPTYDLFPRY